MPQCGRLRERLHLCGTVETHINHVAVDFEDFPLWCAYPAFRERAHNLLSLGRSLLDRCDGELQTLFAVIVLFETESTRRGSLVSALRRAFRGLVEHLLQLPVLDTAPEVFWCDARNADRAIDRPCDLYAVDMERCLHVFNRILKNRGVAVVIVGRESRVRGVPFKNGDIIMQLASSGNLLHVESSHERKYTNRFGTTIFEDILVLRKQETTARSNVGRSVAEQALRRALSSATSDVRRDIKDALSELNSIAESPVMHGASDF